MKRGFDLNLGLEEEGEGEEWGNSPLGQEEEEGEESGDSQKGPALDINALAGGEEEEGAPGGWTEVEGEVTRRSNEEEGNQGEDDDDGEEEQEDEEQEEEEDEEGGEAAAAAAREDAEGVDEAAADIEAELERGEDEDERDGRPTGGSKSAITDREMRDAGQERPGTGRRGHEGSAERPQEGDGGVDGLGVGRGDRDQEEDGGGLGGAESDGSDYNAVDEDDDRAAPGAAEAGSGEARLPASGTEDASKGSAKENPELPPPPKRRFVIKKRPVGARKPESQGPSGVGGGAPVRGVGGASVRDVAEHYSARENQRVDVRESSPIIHLKKLNNWIKSVLIRRYTQPGDYVLDLACGKGGDLIKWDFAKIGFYLGIDVAKGSIYDAAARYNGESMEDGSLMSRKYHFPAKLVCADCYGVPLANDLAQFGPFDVCSCQFALHYSFQSEARARQALINVSELLAPGGYFIGTIPDANVIVRKLRASPSLKFGNLVYSIEFDPQFASKTFPKGNPFGIEYLFNLEDAVACPEWLIPFPSLQALAAEYGLELVEKMNFHDFIHQNVAVEELAKIMQRVVGRDWHETITKDEWDAAYLYCAYVFRKAGEKEASGKRKREDEGGSGKKYRVDSDDILFL